MPWQGCVGQLSFIILQLQHQVSQPLHDSGCDALICTGAAGLSIQPAPLIFLCPSHGIISLRRAAGSGAHVSGVSDASAEWAVVLNNGSLASQSKLSGERVFIGNRLPTIPKPLLDKF